jgi:hypothetical protein
MAMLLVEGISSAATLFTPLRRVLCVIRTAAVGAGAIDRRMWSEHCILERASP